MYKHTYICQPRMFLYRRKSTGGGNCIPALLNTRELSYHSPTALAEVANQRQGDTYLSHNQCRYSYLYSYRCSRHLCWHSHRRSDTVQSHCIHQRLKWHWLINHQLDTWQGETTPTLMPWIHSKEWKSSKVMVRALHVINRNLENW